MMDERKFLIRKINLKRQAIAQIKREIVGLQLRLALIKLKDRYEAQIENADSSLSQKLDCITYLIENFT